MPGGLLALFVGTGNRGNSNGGSLRSRDVGNYKIDSQVAPIREVNGTHISPDFKDRTHGLFQAGNLVSDAWANGGEIGAAEMAEAEQMRDMSKENLANTKRWSKATIKASENYRASHELLCETTETVAKDHFSQQSRLNTLHQKMNGLARGYAQQRNQMALRAAKEAKRLEQHQQQTAVKFQELAQQFQYTR